jgi:hypothetical protein
MDLNKITLDIDDVIDQWGEFYLKEGQNMENLHMLPFETFGTAEAGTMIPTEQTVLREANVRVQEILQQYQDDFTSKGGVTMKPINIFLYNMKVDVGVIPHKLIKAWTGFLTNSGNDPQTYPFIQWLVQDYLLKQADEDIEMKAIYKGIYEAPVEGTAGEAVKSMNGIDFYLNELEDDGDITPFNIGDVDSMIPKDFVTALEENFVKEIPERYRYNTELELSMNRTYRDKFKQGMRDKYNINYLQTDQLLRLMDFENVTVKGRASMMGKKRIWTTPKFNLLVPVKGFSNKNGFDVQKLDRKIKFLTDWWMGVGFVQPEIIYTTSEGSNSVS